VESREGLFLSRVLLNVAVQRTGGIRPVRRLVKIRRAAVQLDSCASTPTYRLMHIGQLGAHSAERAFLELMTGGIRELRAPEP